MSGGMAPPFTAMNGVLARSAVVVQEAGEQSLPVPLPHQHTVER